MPKSRGHSDPWFNLGSLEITTTVIVTFLCVLSVFVWAAQGSDNPAIFLHTVVLPDEVKSGQIWRLLTWPVGNDLAGSDAIWKAVSIALFWYFGREIENQIGRVKYTWMLVLIAVISGLAATGLDVGLGYIHSVEVALFVVFVFENPRRPFFFGIPAWVLALVLVGVEVLQDIGYAEYRLIVVLMVTIATAVWAARSFGMLVDQQWLPMIKLPKRRPKVSPTPSFDQRSGRSRSTVIDGPWAGSAPAYKPMQDQAEVDKILDKIALVGMDGLTSDEKKRLNEASKRLRKQGN
jgi:membrane associated rhomboid family serine protease